MLENTPLLAKIGADTAENEPNAAFKKFIAQMFRKVPTSANNLQTLRIRNFTKFEKNFMRLLVNHLHTNMRSLTVKSRRRSLTKACTGPTT